MNLPPHPRVGDLVKEGKRTWLWDGAKWSKPKPAIASFSSDFWPTDPAPGEQVTDNIGRRWQWDGEKWLGTAWIPSGVATFPGIENAPFLPLSGGTVTGQTIFDGTAIFSLNNARFFTPLRYGMNSSQPPYVPGDAADPLQIVPLQQVQALVAAGDGGGGLTQPLTLTQPATLTTSGNTASSFDINNSGTGDALRIRNGATTSFRVMPDGRIDTGINPTASTNYRMTSTNNGTWGSAGISITNTADGMGLRVSQSATTSNINAGGINVGNAGAGSGININNTGSGPGIRVSQSSTTPTGDAGIWVWKTGNYPGITLHHTAGTGPGMTFTGGGTLTGEFVNMARNITGTCLSLNAIQPAVDVTGIDIDSRGPGKAIRVRNNVTEHFVVVGGATPSFTVSPAMRASMRAALGLEP